MKRSCLIAVLAGILSASLPATGKGQSSDAETALPDAIAEPELPAPLESLLGANERRFRPAIRRIIEERDANQAIKEIDALMLSLNVNSPMQLFLQTYKAQRVVESGRVEEGEAAFQALMDEYPELLVIKLSAIHSLGYTTAADTAARLWIETSARHPEDARAVGGYTLGAVAGNLEARSQIDLRDALFLTLDNIGYDPGTASLRNQMQVALFTNAAADTGREDQAREALAKITDPEQLINIAAQRRFQAYWSEIDTGPASIEGDTEALLDAMKNDFIAAGNGTAAGAFLSHAVTFTEPEAAANAYTPVLDRIMEQGERSAYSMYDAMFWVAPLARAWGASGSPERAHSLYEAALRSFGDSRGVNRLNVSANYAVHLLENDRPREALEYIEPAIADLEASDSALTALPPMHAVRLRAYHQLGQSEQAAASRQNLEANKSALLNIYVDTMLAIGEEAAAKDALLTELRSADPIDAISYLQLPLNRLVQPARVEAESAKERMRHDPEIARALQEVGRIVDVSPVSVSGFDHAGVAREFLNRMN
ncbi:hypothetical protein G7A66_09005 [Altererythrobacter sp. SALINAS58]|uniref:hypothetical protein n=1 Tax=Alteripontixanthobacter muriae TaxID=2705546 RepID=UPI001575E0CA|nr:hypothetical protein [Alteripontixanthobacter muriae]NTZ43226.1 hypothetical protein [Alteripontixanthobacter muriae]